MGIKRGVAGIVFVAANCFAQTDSITNPYYKSYPEKLSVQVFVLNTSNDFTLNYEAEQLDVKLEPNKKTTLGVAVQYDFIAFSLGFAPRFFADNKDNKDSKMTSFNFSLFPGKIMQHLDFYYQKGFTLSNANTGKSIYFPKLKSIKAGGSTSYMFNPNFSFRATAFQNQKQLKSAGTFAPTLTYYYTSLNGKKVEELNSKVYFIDVALSPAYYYNWVIAQNFLVSGGASAGAGFTYTDDEGDTETTFLTQASLHLSLGYNSDTFYGGLQTKGFLLNHKNEGNVTVDDTVSFFTLFAGYRFDVPEFLIRETEVVKTKVNALEGNL